MPIQRTKDATVLVDVADDPDPSVASDPTSMLGRIRSIDFSRGRADLDHDEVGDDSRRRDQGPAGFELSVEVTVDPSDPGQDVIRDAILDADEVIVHYLHDGTNGYEQICVASTQDGALEAGQLKTDTIELQASSGYVYNSV